MRLGDPYNLADLKPRALVLAFFFSALFLILSSRLWYLQIWKGDEYRSFADKNRFKIKRVAAPRGQIFDRNGHLLADNRPRFDVYFTRGYSSDFAAELEIIKDIFSWNEQELIARTNEIQKSSPYLPKLIARDIKWTELSKLEGNNLELNGVDIEVLAVRDYLYGDAFFHVLGYPGEVNERDLKRLKEKYPERNYRLGDQIGVIGVESLYESFLRGRDGREFLVVDVRGRPVQRSELEIFTQSIRQDASAGRRLELSLDLELQLSAVNAFGDQTGAAVAIDPKTGEVLAMVSRPGLDPNWFTEKLSKERLSEFRNNPEQPYLDRTLGEHYPPGSTYKLVMAAAGLEENVITPETLIYCPGTFTLGRRTWHDHNRAGYGKIAIREAIQKSSNVFFFNLGLELGLDRMFKWSELFGLGRRTNVGHEVFVKNGKLTQKRRFNSEQSGFIPNEDWVRRVGNTTPQAETINAGIGQGAFLVTITQLARVMSILGNKGKVFQPKLLNEVQTASGEPVMSFSPILESEIKFHKATLDSIYGGMSDVVNEPGGTAWRARLKDFHVGGKTGTSQVVSLSKSEGKDLKKDDRKLQDHALFVALAPLEDPEIAVAIIVEHAGFGGSHAAPIARAMINNYLTRKHKGDAVGEH